MKYRLYKGTRKLNRESNTNGFEKLGQFFMYCMFMYAPGQIKSYSCRHCHSNLVQIYDLIKGMEVLFPFLLLNNARLFQQIVVDMTTNWIT